MMLPRGGLLPKDRLLHGSSRVGDHHMLGRVYNREQWNFYLCFYLFGCGANLGCRLRRGSAGRCRQMRLHDRCASSLLAYLRWSKVRRGNYACMYAYAHRS
jgi:hypothetical protein